ncbi:MAG: ATP-dependent Clp protease ATP-binding subunit [Firmicutes bacterium]|nr:ATP-dependent Clp protease ATP-binding subunit [Bacillota bacterium]
MNITQNVHKIIQAAIVSAQSSGVPPMPLHLLYGCSVVSECLASRLLKEAGITRGMLENVSSALAPDLTFNQILEHADAITLQMGQTALVSENLLLVLVRDCAQTMDVLEKLSKGSPKRLEQMILQNSDIPLKSNENVKESAIKSSVPEDILRLGADLTLKAKQGKIDTIIGRDEETQRVIEILSRKTKNNPVLIGEAGVGKSAIVEGLALRIVGGNVPKQLENKTIFSLDIGSLMAGTKYRGELEARLEKLLKLIEERKDIILFIDEIHQITTASGKEGEVGISEILKPKLARGEMQTIGATTTEEYRRFIEKDAALERRFAPIIVNPPTPGQAIEILQGLKTGFESFHDVEIGGDAIVAAVTMSDRYITDRNLPDKAIDMLDEACAKKKIWNMKNGSGAKPTIDADDIAEVVSKATGVPVTKLTSDERERLKNLEEELKKQIIGQDKAVAAIAKAVRRSRAGVADANRPVGSFMFLGRTGTGKTETCKVLASQLFTSDKSLIKLDMSEFSEAHSVSKLIGSPPGYVGYDDASALCERVRRNPYSLVLFDEIEKAHPEVYNILLQILDEGRLTDNKGKTTSFKNCLIVMTSNVGVENIAKTKKIGFSGEDDTQNVEEEAAMMAGLKKRFKPEFINRIDNVIVFNSLSKENVGAIARIHIEKLVKKLGGIGIELFVSNDAVDYLVDKGYNHEFGARPLRRLLQTEIEDKIAERILSDSVRVVKVDVADSELVFEFN